MVCQGLRREVWLAHARAVCKLDAFVYGSLREGGRKSNALNLINRGTCRGLG